MNDLKVPVTFLLLLLVLLGIVLLISPSRTITQQLPVRAPVSNAYNPTNPPPPQPTPALLETVRNSAGFQALVSYTDRGFEPSTVTIRKGETIRFTNNSNKRMWVSSVGEGGGEIYVGTGNDCGQSAFDTCRALSPGEFWEFTFKNSGTWSYQNQVGKELGTVVVRK